MDIAILTASGAARVLNGRLGQPFPIAHFTDEADKLNGCIAADFRNPGNYLPFQPWSLSRGDYALTLIAYENDKVGWSMTLPITIGKVR